MTRRVLIVGLLAVAPAWAEDSVSANGGYYYEYEAQNNRVVAPSMELRKDLPGEAEASLYFLVDQITSASAAFQGGADQLYVEYRKEIAATLRQRYGEVTPGVSVRRSDEPDYESTTVGLDAAFSLFQGATTVRVLGQFQDDNVGKRGVPSFREDVDSYMAGLHVVQALNRHLQVGLGAEATQVDGFQSNAYRRCASGSLESHPSHRERLATVAWGAYYVRPTRSTLYAWYRFYDDNWAVRAHTGELRITQRVVAPLAIEAAWRPHTQTAVYFVDERVGGRYCTGDPKLGAFNSNYFEGVLRVSVPPFLFLREPRIEAAMGHLSQDNQYGDAVLARLGGSFAF